MSMKNRRVFVFSVLIVIVVLMLEMRFKAVSECLLMESKHSLYSRLFMLEKEGWGTYTINDLDSSNRLALNTLREINGSGISLTRSKDGSITVVGSHERSECPEHQSDDEVRKCKVNRCKACAGGPSGLRFFCFGGTSFFT